MSNRILHAKDINITFGALRAVSDFNLELREKELVGLIGPNGAGKTTVFNILTGVYSATSGTYTFNGIEVKKTPTYKLVRRGLARTFQNIRLFKNMSVLDNVLVANNFNMKYGVFTGIFRLPKFWLEERRAKKKALKLLRIFDLDKYADTPAGSLPYGQQRKLEIARAMATNPKVLLLDEPAAGMNPTETEELMKTIKLIRDKFGIAILLIEHDMKLVLGICERLIVLDHGTIIASGDPQKVVNDPAVVTAYLGKDDDEIDEEEEENKKIASVKAEIFNDEEEE
ncbi:ABC transporter ATP-binding protein [Fusobacterium mortiferum]|jgi:branched-chain amino acid transport system ATP-binding protein|uniref:ABC transporter ATP-binding protein n=2 Tax=Fusobacterium TaxID=848 RepID=A0ABS2G486_FUSMR|nr:MULTISPECIES: ABC transporter ATP-binding protein [Fusobacterium]MBU3842996.1 ABC transporter ATP-binding protein [Candidatus Fusobacterium pullicola]MBM6690638.1 ABC transporter ATP-binding protein [Fusobacterium mortiferum]MBM6822064.1 ABC transporter ATP-binding protein [Fusobacterium mortiferum]MBM6875494.1 ABC transporter ATP-binding protein [Fusobacterium mortiferum]MDO5788469.1 ABC transporter ATP-binding protein [Fusobacterium sp.]